MEEKYKKWKNILGNVQFKKIRLWYDLGNHIMVFP